MPSLERTAYPRFGRVITALELERSYTPTDEEIAWMRSMVRMANHRLCLAVSLKCFQRLHHFPELESVPETVINHLRQCLQMNQAVEVRYDRPNTMYRHRQLIRDWLEVQPYHDNVKARRIAASAALRASAVLDDPVDIVNAMIEELQRESIELPAYSTLDRFAGRAHAAADRRLFRRTMRHISGEQRQALDQLLTVDFERSFSAFQTLKTPMTCPEAIRLRKEYDLALRRWGQIMLSPQIGLEKQSWCESGSEEDCYVRSSK